MSREMGGGFFHEALFLLLGWAVASQVGKIDAVSDDRAVAVVAVEMGTVHTISGSMASSFLCGPMCLGYRISAQVSILVSDDLSVADLTTQDTISSHLCASILPENRILSLLYSVPNLFSVFAPRRAM